MANRPQFSPGALTVLIVLGVVFVGAVTFSGIVAAQSGEVDLQDPIIEDAQEFDVEISELDGVGRVGYLVVENSEEEAIGVAEDGTYQFDVGDIGGISAGDEIEATLYTEEDGEEINSDSVTVTAISGVVELQDPITSDSFMFDIEVTELVTDDGSGMLEVENENRGEGVFTTTVEDGYDDPVNTGDIGGIEEGDVVTATLYPDDSFTPDLDSDSTIVSAPSGTIEVEDPIMDDADEFDVDILELESRGDSGTMIVTNEETGESIDYQVQEGETVPISVSDVGEIDEDDTITATLYSGLEPVEEDILDTDSTTVTAAPFFEVIIESDNSPVTEGETYEIDATIENTGDHPDTQEIFLVIDSVTRDTTSLTLDGGEEETVTLTWDTEAGDAGMYFASVGSEDMTTGIEGVVVEEGEPAEFEVAIDSTNSPVTEGETLDVEATIENTGDLEGTQSIDLDIGGTVVDTTSVTLGGTEQQTVILSWDTEAGDAGEHIATVSSDDDSDSTAVAVNEPGNFEVSIDATNSPVVEEETLDVEATIENTGDLEDTQTIELAIGESTIDSTTVTLDGGEAETVTLNWETEIGDAGEYTATVSSENDADTAAVEVLEEANFAVSIDATNSPVVEGESLDVEATIENTGDLEDTQTIELAIGESTIDSTTVTLDGGESETVTLSWATEVGDAGEYTATVSSEDDSDTTGVEVIEDANFEVSIDATNSPVLEGETLEVNATIQNTGDLEDTQTIDLIIGESVVDSTTLTLDSGENESVGLHWETQLGDAGEHIATVSSDDDSDSTAVQVTARTLESASFTVDIDSTNAPVVEEETLEVYTAIENTGQAAGTQTIELTVGEETLDTTTLTLNGGETETVTLNWDTELGDAGEYTATVSSDDDSDAADVEVLEPATFAVTIDSTDSPVQEGETLGVDATIENTGGESDTQTVELDIGGETVDSTSLTLDAGESQPLSLSWETEDSDEGEHTATVSSEDDADSTSVIVGDSAEGAVPGDELSFDVDIESTNAPVVEGEELTVTAQITNTGSETGTQDITLDIGGVEHDSEELTLDEGESQAVTLTWGTEAGDAGEHTATVSSETAEDSTTVTVEEEDVEPVTFTVIIDSVTQPDGDGSSYEAAATIENTGDRADTQTISFSTGGVERDSQSLTLEPGESQTLTFSWEQDPDEIGEDGLDIEVSSESDTDFSTAGLIGGDDDSLVSTSMLLLLLLLLALILATYYYVRRRRM